MNSNSSNKLLTKSLFKKVRSSLDDDSFWSKNLNSFESLKKFPHGIHLAILVEPYLSFILNGKKTVESRFSVNRSPPYKKVQRGDIILLKRSGGPIIGICEVTNVWFYRLDPKSWKMIRKEFTDLLCVQDPEFWKDRRSASYATLMGIRNPKPLEPMEIDKRDMRGWVVLRQKNNAQLTLDELT